MRKNVSCSLPRIWLCAAEQDLSGRRRKEAAHDFLTKVSGTRGSSEDHPEKQEAGSVYPDCDSASGEDQHWQVDSVKDGCREETGMRTGAAGGCDSVPNITASICSLPPSRPLGPLRFSACRFPILGVLKCGVTGMYCCLPSYFPFRATPVTPGTSANSRRLCSAALGASRELGETGKLHFPCCFGVRAGQRIVLKRWNERAHGPVGRLDRVPRGVVPRIQLATLHLESSRENVRGMPLPRYCSRTARGAVVLVIAA